MSDSIDSRVFMVQNTSGETWPAHAIAKLGSVISREGVAGEMQIHGIDKPDSASGIFVVNGDVPIPDGVETSAVYWQDAVYVLVGSEVVAQNDEIGPTIGQWYASDENPGLIVQDVKDSEDIAPVVAAGGGGCDCECCEFIFESDITLLDGTPSRNRYSITFDKPVELDTAGIKITLTPPSSGSFTAIYTTSTPSGKEGWNVATSTLEANVTAKNIVTGDPVTPITGLVVRLYVDWLNDTDYIEPKTVLTLELGTTP
jgi:hypothetical protein